MTDLRTDYDIHDEAAENALSDAMHATNSSEQEKFLAIAHIEAARAHAAATRELAEHQHTANLIAADRLDTILSPHGIGGDEYNAFWAMHAGNITRRLGMGE